MNLTLISLATGFNPNIAGSLGSLRSVRLGSGTQTTSGLGTIFGPLVQGLGAAAGAYAGSKSARDFKEDIRPIPEGEALKAVETLDLSTWQYKPEMGLGLERHAGPMAEDMKGLGLSDGRSVHPMDSAGLGLAAVKALAKKVERLEHSLDLAEAA